MKNAAQRSRATLARRLAALLGLASMLTASLPAAASDIYTCTDAQGRTITADRPISACLDRVQRQLNAHGTTIRVIEPQATGAEHAAAQARELALAQERERQEAQQREAAQHDRTLLIRFPTPADHDRARHRALEQITAALDAAAEHLATLTQERHALETERAEHIATTPDDDLPAELAHRIERNRNATEVTRRLVDMQQAEIDRINARWDAEAARLRSLWQATTPGDTAED